MKAAIMGALSLLSGIAQSQAPSFACSDPVLKAVYDYRAWMLAEHVKDIGGRRIITEFLPSVPWEGPHGTISAAAGHHVREARWMDQGLTKEYLQYWFTPDSGIRNYSFWAADSVWQLYLATGDLELARELLPAMKENYAGWDHRFDGKQGLYWQVPIADATEYTVSGMAVNDGFNGGDAFRPTINAYQYADAAAISRFSALLGDMAGAKDYAAKAAALKAGVQKKLWNPKHRHFMDRFAKKYPNRYFQFISHPELAGFVPWAFDLPDPKFAVAWKSLMDPEKFYAPFGPRTLVPDHPEYMVQHRTPGASPGECEWNGPSWPFQTSLVLTGLANLLGGPAQMHIGKDDYFKLLRNYALSQYKDGKPYVAENLNPDTGAWIADFPKRSEHYNHSSFCDLIITGLAGLRPRADGVVEINPLIPEDMEFLSLERIPYQGHELAVFWKRGEGLKLTVDGKIAASSPGLARLEARL